MPSYLYFRAFVIYILLLSNLYAKSPYAYTYKVQQNSYVFFFTQLYTIYQLKALIINICANFHYMAVKFYFHLLNPLERTISSLTFISIRFPYKDMNIVTKRSHLIKNTIIYRFGLF